MRVLGMISGTSRHGLPHGDIEHAGTTPYAPSLRERLVRALPPAALTFADICALDTLIGQAFADAAAVEQSGGADLICSHGQTVYHWVDGGQVLGTLHIG